MGHNPGAEAAPRTNRFSATPIWRAHLKGLRNRNFRTSDRSGSTDVLTLVALYGLPVGLGAVAYLLGGNITGTDGLLAAAGILAGALFMAFTQVAAWRDRYTARIRDAAASELPQRYSLDETVAHILMATYACLVLATVVLVGANFADDQERVGGVIAAMIIAMGAYVLLLMFIILPKLYAAYAITHEVDSEMSGLSR